MSIMDLKPPIYAKSSLLVLVLLLEAFFIKSSTAQSTPFSVRVGVVVDMDSDVGEMGLNCITMALSDFYSKHNHYETRLLLTKRDSKKDVVGAAAAALDLLKNVQVQAMIGPLTSMEANFVINLGDKAHVPIITFSTTSPFLRLIPSRFFIRAASTDSSQVEAIAAVVKAFGWREVVPIHVDNEFGQGMMPSLVDALEDVTANIPYRSVIPSLATDDQIASELRKMMEMDSRVFIVHMLPDLGSRLFTIAKVMGMMSEGYVWIITDGIANELNSIDPSVVEAMEGVIGVRPHVPRTQELDNFKIRYKKAYQLALNIFGLWAYDSAVALALAVEAVGVSNATDKYWKSNVSTSSTDLEGIGVSGVGNELIKALESTTFRGLAGEFKLVDGHLKPPPYQIVNVVGSGVRVVGYWTKENGIVRDLKYTTTSASSSSLGPIIWPGDTASPPKGRAIPKLRIGVPVKYGFTGFVNVTWNSNNTPTVEGYCMELFDMAIKKVPYGVQYEYIPFSTPDHKTAGSYDDLVYQVNKGKFDAVVGDVTIIANRSKFVDFTLPYTESGVSMVVAVKDDKSKKAWVFLKPLTWELWLTSFCSFFFIGFLIWILEHRINEDFRGPPWYQVGMIFWFGFSTMVFANKERVVSNLSRFLLILWFLVVLILTQSYTASLTSMLTVEQLRPSVRDVNDLLKHKDNVGYLSGSFVHGFLMGMGFNESRLLAYNSPEELDGLFTNGTILAAFDETPYMKIVLAKYCSKYIMIGPTNKTDGFGFVFPIGSRIVADISRAILNVTEGAEITEIENKWLGDDSKCPYRSELAPTNSLGLESFWGLFLIVGIAGVSALITCLIRFLYENRHALHLGSKSIELFRRFDDKDLSCHTFKNSTREKKEGCGCECGIRMMQISVDHPRTSTSSRNNNDYGPPDPTSFYSTSEVHRVVQQEGEDEQEMDLQNQELPTTRAELR